MSLDSDDALELLHFAFREIVLAPDRLLAKRSLGRVHHRILYMCRRQTGLSIGELLRILGVTKQALNRPLNELQTRRLLVQKPDASDRRTRRLALTKRGLAFEAKLSGLQREAFAQVFAEVGASAAAQWARVMSRLARGQTATVLRGRRASSSGLPPDRRSVGQLAVEGRTKGASRAEVSPCDGV